MPSPQEILAYSKQNPVWWMEHVLGCKPWGRQQDIANALVHHRRVAVPSCHGSGKSWLAARLVLWFLATRPQSIVATTAPTFRQVEKILWQELKVAHAKAIFPLGGRPLRTSLKFADGWFAFGFATDTATGAHGLHAPGGVFYVFDEASGVPTAIWDGIEGSLTGAECRLLSIGNPTDPFSKFAEECRNPATKVVPISAYDLPNVTSGKSLIPGLTELSWVQDKEVAWKDKVDLLWYPKVLGLFPPLAGDSLLKDDWIGKSDNPPQERALGVDVARFGDDETCIFGSWGEHLYAGRGADTMQIAEVVAELMVKTQSLIANVDGVGVGAGVCDRLRQLGFPVREIVASARPSDRETFVNYKAELFWGFRKAAELGKTHWPADDETLRQLRTLKYELTSDGKLAMEPKKKAKHRLGYSPDRAEAFIYAAIPGNVFTGRLAESEILSQESRYA